MLQKPRLGEGPGQIISLKVAVFKYDGFLSRYSQCPPSHYEELDVEAFRIVKSNPPTDKSFVPVGVHDQSRFRNRDEDYNCKCCGLSFFDSERALLARVQELRKDHPQIEKRIGSMIAKARLTSSDGVGERNTGHFTFHEYQGARLDKKFVVISESIP